MTLTEQQIQDNYNELRKIINDTFSGLRLDKLNYMYDDLEDRMVVKSTEFSRTLSQFKSRWICRTHITL